MSTTWVGEVLFATTTRRTPFHGAKPSWPSSGKIQRLAASATPSSTVRPSARWSAEFHVPGPHVSWWLIVTTRCGRCWRIARAMSLRSSRLSVRRPSRWRKNSTSRTPTAPALASSSASRSGPALAGAIVSMPASPEVAIA
ncbi:MAG: hypothetical protein PGN11_19875 [Quadrisphaera sp.]